MKNNFKLTTGRAVFAAIVFAATALAADGIGRSDASGQTAAAQTQTPTQVIVTNTTAQPVPTKDQDNPAKQPFAHSWQFSSGANQSELYTTFSIPAGKRMVIETVTGYIIVKNSAGAQGYFKLSTFAAGGTYQDAFVPLGYAGHGMSSGWEAYMGTVSMRLYADSTHPLYLFAEKTPDINFNQTGLFDGYITVSGYLVDVQ